MVVAAVAAADQLAATVRLAGAIAAAPARVDLEAAAAVGQAVKAAKDTAWGKIGWL